MAILGRLTMTHEPSTMSLPRMCQIGDKLPSLEQEHEMMRYNAVPDVAYAEPHAGP